jgi:hypothetical protein
LVAKVELLKSLKFILDPIDKYSGEPEMVAGINERILGLQERIRSLLFVIVQEKVFSAVRNVTYGS